MERKEFWVRSSKGQHGPYPGHLLQRLVGIGLIKAEMQLSFDGTAWYPAGEMPGLFGSSGVESAKASVTTAAEERPPSTSGAPTHTTDAPQASTGSVAADVERRIEALWINRVPCGSALA